MKFMNIILCETIYNSRTWLIKDLVKFIEYVGGWSQMNSYKFYDYWLKNISDEKELKISKTIKKFYFIWR